MTTLSLKDTWPEYLSCPTRLLASGSDKGPGILRTFSLVDNRELSTNKRAQFSSANIEPPTIYGPNVGTLDLCNQTSQGILGWLNISLLLNSEEVAKGQKEVCVLNSTGGLSEEYMDKPSEVGLLVFRLL